MQSVPQQPFSTLASNEFLQDRKFLYATRLNSARIVKDVALMVGKHEFVVDAVFASLDLCFKGKPKERYHTVTNIHGRIKFNLVGNEIRLADITAVRRRTCSFPR